MLQVSAAQMATDIYQDKLDEAAKTVDYDDKSRIYQECIAIPDKASETDAYLGLIQLFKEDDSALSVEEAKILVKQIKNHKAQLLADPAGYAKVCFETGKLFWYYYEYGDANDNQITRMKSAVEWFEDTIAHAPAGDENLNMARVYANVGAFYRDISINTVEASDKGQYRPFFDNLAELMDAVAQREDESEIVRLELLELARSSLQQYAAKLKIDGVSREEMDAMYRQVSKVIRTIETTTDKTEEKKRSILSLLDDTRDAIDTVYSTDKEVG